MRHPGHRVHWGAGGRWRACTAGKARQAVAGEGACAMRGAPVQARRRRSAARAAAGAASRANTHRPKQRRDARVQRSSAWHAVAVGDGGAAPFKPACHR